MPSALPSSHTPGLTSFLKSTKTNSIESSVELLVSLLQRRQIRNSRQCALATAQLLLRVVASERVRDAQALIKRVRGVGRRLVAAQPREMAVGNIVRRVLGIIREVGEESQNQEGSADASDIGSPTHASGHRPLLNSTISSFSPLHHSSALPANMLHTRGGESSGESTPLSQSISDLNATAGDPMQQRPALAPASSTYVGSLFGLFQQPVSTPPPTSTSTPNRPGISSPPRRINPLPDTPSEKLNVKAEVIDGIKELLDELEVVDSQIAESALDHIHSNEIILTHTSSQTVQRFLAAAARKRKFTVVVAEAYPNDHLATHATVVNGGRKVGEGGEEEGDERYKPLTAQGITVILIPDSAVFALMSRINKVIIAPHTVLANGSLLAAAGSSSIALAARAHRVPVVVLSGIYKLSPVYPFDTAELIEIGDPSKVAPFTDPLLHTPGKGELTVSNPVFDHVEAELVDLYITNLGGHAPSYLYRIVADHYRVEDVDLMGKD